MDADRFDALLRSLAQTPSRRSALRLLAGSGLGGLVAVNRGDSDAHNPLKKCKKKSGKQKKKCLKKAKAHNAQHASETPPPVTTIPPPLACGAGGPCLVFVTSSTQNGNLGGLEGANLRCQQLAGAASRPGTYRAWLSTSTQSPDSGFTRSTGPYRRVDGVTIASNYIDLTDGALAAPINVTETGAVISNPTAPTAPIYVWTNTLTNGTVDDIFINCGDWQATGDGSDYFGNVGDSESMTATWTDSSFQACNAEMHLYCFQQS